MTALMQDLTPRNRDLEPIFDLEAVPPTKSYITPQRAIRQVPDLRRVIHPEVAFVADRSVYVASDFAGAE
jgi:hypothetical protein